MSSTHQLTHQHINTSTQSTQNISAIINTSTYTSTQCHQHITHQHINTSAQVINTVYQHNHQHISTSTQPSPHQHLHLHNKTDINTSTHQRNHQDINISTYTSTQSSTHRHIDTSAQSSTHQHIHLHINTIVNTSTRHQHINTSTATSTQSSTPGQNKMLHARKLSSEAAFSGVSLQLTCEKACCARIRTKRSLLGRKYRVLEPLLAWKRWRRNKCVRWGKLSEFQEFEVNLGERLT
jgi:hypothetical protein